MSKIKCRECGKQLSAKARVCPHCGTSTRYKKRIVIPIISIIAIIIIIIILVLLYFAFRKQLYTDVMYSYTASKNDFVFIYSYNFKNDNTYSYIIAESDIKVIKEEMQNNTDIEKLLDKYTKTNFINGTYTIDKKKIKLKENDTKKSYECDIVGYDKIKCNNTTYSFDRENQIEINKYVKSWKQRK